MQERLLGWFATSQRDLPWRRDYTPYKVWVSEIMLQQTQMERGVACFENWMRRFPDLASLAKAGEDEVLKAWEGLGYYSRARNLLRAARRIMEERGGVFPSCVDELRSLPGIGPYTAAAVASIAFQEDVACVDANVERVISRLTDLALPVRQGEGKKLVSQFAQEFLPRGRAREHNQAMMELGALVCAKKPVCSACPLRSFCLAKKRGTADTRPLLPTRTQRVSVTVACGLLLHEGRIFIQRRLPGDVWGGLWEFPGGCREEHEKPEETIVREFREENGFHVCVRRKLIVLKTNYTKYNITVHFFLLDFEDTNLEKADIASLPRPVLTEADAFCWVTIEELAALPMPSLHRKLAQTLILAGDTLRTSLADTGRPLARLLVD